MLNRKQLSQMTRQELCDYCRLYGIKGYSGKTKTERVKLILNHYKSELAKKQIKPKKPRKERISGITYIIRRQSIPTDSKKDKEWKFYIKKGKERIYIAEETGEQKLVRLEGSKGMLRDTLRWRYSIGYSGYHEGRKEVLDIGTIVDSGRSSDYGYYVSNITDIVVDRMNKIAKDSGSKNRFEMYKGKKGLKAEPKKPINKELLKKNLKANIKKGKEVQNKFLKAKIRTEEKQKYSEELDKLTKENVELREKLGLSVYSEFSKLYEISKIITRKSDTSGIPIKPKITNVPKIKIKKYPEYISSLQMLMDRNKKEIEICENQLKKEMKKQGRSLGKGKIEGLQKDLAELKIERKDLLLKKKRLDEVKGKKIPK